jgi:hypothetical protein
MTRALALLAAASLLALTACSGADNDEAADFASTGGSASEAPAPAEREAGDSSVAGAADLGGQADSAAKPAVSTRSVIATGNVALRSPDVAQALFDVRQVVDQVTGEVAEEKTDTDKSGEVVRSRLVLRVPSASFDEAMESLKGAADLVSAGSTAEDVTTQVLDVDVRVRVQRRSIERIELLLDRAESIGDIVSIEAQLSQRQADLASLEQQQAYLADQTSLSTITVSLERTPANAAPADEKDDEAGFLTGLDAGWDALKTFGVGLATFLGAVLPWTLVLLVLGVPGWTVLRRLRRRTTTAPPAVS